MINVIVIGAHQLQAEGIAMMIESNSEFKVLDVHIHSLDFLHKTYEEPVHVIVKNISKITADDISDVQEIQRIHTKAYVFIISYAENE